MSLTRAEIQSNFALLPNVRTVTLVPKTAFASPADTTATPLPLPARRRTAKQSEIVRAGLLMSDTVIVYSVLDDGTRPFREPKIEDTIIDGTRLWNIMSVGEKLQECLYPCICIERR